MISSLRSKGRLVHRPGVDSTWGEDCWGLDCLVVRLEFFFLLPDLPSAGSFRREPDLLFRLRDEEVFLLVERLRELEEVFREVERVVLRFWAI